MEYKNTCALKSRIQKKGISLVKQKGFYTYEYMSHFENPTEELPSEEMFQSSLTSKRKNSDKEHETS